MVTLPQTTSPTVEAIDQHHVAQNQPRHSRRIGGAWLGRPCERQAWYKFRWAYLPEEFSGRMLRLFETGHREEARMIEDLRAAGVLVEDVDPETGEQWSATAVDGHFLGFADGILSGVLEAPKTRHLFEAKTHGQKSFDQLVKHGVTASKPEHVAQMQIYMHLLGLTRAFYLAKNKNTDELHAERLEYDAAHAAALLAKAERITEAHEPPARISEDPEYYLCRAFKCPAFDICHGSGLPLRNCRTCLHSTPIPMGRWYCDRHDKELSWDDQDIGCPNHLYLPGLVAGDQVDVDQHAETVTYRMTNGSTWVDGHAPA